MSVRWLRLASAFGLSGIARASRGATVVGFGLLVAFTAAAQEPASRVANGRVENGKSLFEARCGMCHLQGGTGTFMLGRRLGPANAMLAERTNLDATYVRHVVRHGLVSMPRITRAEVSDAELQAIVAYLTREPGTRKRDAEAK